MTYILLWAVPLPRSAACMTLRSDLLKRNYEMNITHVKYEGLAIGGGSDKFGLAKVPMKFNARQELL